MCGILTEISGEIDAIKYVIVGVGINVNADLNNFDNQLKEKVSSLKIIKNEKIDRKKLFSNVLNSIDYYYSMYIDNNDFSIILNEYKSKLTIINKQISIVIGKSIFTGITLDIMSNGALKVKLSSGEIREFISGEISIFQ